MLRIWISLPLSFFVLCLGLNLSGITVLAVASDQEAEKLNNSLTTARHTLYFLSILPYPDPEPSLHPVITTSGLHIFPAVQLAVDHVNNRSDVLRDYHIELIETDGGCDISSKALISLVSQLFHSNKQIVGIIGPACSDSASAVGALSRRSEIALLSFHHGSSPLLADRDAYPYSIGMALSPADIVKTFTDFFEMANWTRIAVLYSTEVLFDYSMFQLFQRDAKSAGIEVAFSEVVSETFIPHKELKESYARVIIAFVRADVASRIMCVAYHNKLIYPTYQWILSNGYAPVTGRLHFHFHPEDRDYSCNEQELNQALNSVVNFTSELPSAPNNTEIVSGLSMENTVEAYHQRLITNTTDEVSYTYTDTYYAFLAYDSVWAMALALNGSLETLQEKNMSLTNYTYGQSSATEVILEHLYQLEFHGVSGLISFNEQTGYTRHIPVYSYYPLVENSFETETLKVAICLAVIVIIVIALTSVLVAFVHVLNTVYWDYKTIKASSSRLNHFAYVGCYCFLLALLIHTIVEAFSISPLATTVLCNFIPWLTSIGFSLVFGTVIVKTWRVYVIFIRCELKSCNKTYLKDFPLSLIMVCFSAVNITLCTVWSVTDPLRYEAESTINIEHVTEEVREVCTCERFLLWLALAVVYNGFLVASAVVLAQLTRKIYIKKFKTTNITLLVYLLFLVTGLGVPVYFILWYLGVNVNISYSILCVVVTALVYLCWVLLFLPPVLPLLKEKKNVFKFPELSRV